MGGPVTPINSFEDFTAIINSGKPVIIDFWATWCGPCRIISPIFEKLAEVAPDGIDFYKVDTDAQEQIAMELTIRSLPTFHLFKDGQVHKTVIGANPSGLENLFQDAAKLVTA